MEELFKTVRFGGYDKEEVLDFINNKFEYFEKKEKENKETILDNRLEIETLKNKLLDYEEKLASTLVENQRLVDIITHHETLLHQEYTQSQIVGTLVTAKNISDKIIKEAKETSDQILNIAKSKAYQEIKFKTDANEVLLNYEKRFKIMIKNISALNEISNTLVKKVVEIDNHLKDMAASLPFDLKENDE